ncbi:hypothetical protein M406DRAFT_358507 [Cryphonectria parasitica EP155]|uniref:Uncharacterized protein n=1 Tax=Cryphonectria parasitica (strain ATCC 38755 / EP155) TaxID=660469 RepID=A0A9P4XUR7_CRYP1|nr:uncharacterized protein M406DRAFT_358507 [Cryphonectria parasitica EP155]KAF3761187.1 hypothetical protein M406DRAFT_358507 [Cryphonectria parasitica EP155]
MASQSTASAASTSPTNTPRNESIGPSSPVQPLSGVSRDDGDVHILNAPAAIKWQNDQDQDQDQAQSQCLGHEDGARVSVDFHLDSLSNTAFFSFHTRVVLKALPFSKTNVYLWLPPERVLSIILNEQEEDVIIESKKRAATSLHFELDKPAALVGPCLSLTPRNKKHGDTLDSMRLLANSKRFTVFLQSRSASMNDLRQLCRAFTPILTSSSSSVTTSAHQQQRTRPTMMIKHTYIANLYKGHGGSFITGGFEAASDPGQPPEYDQIEPGPPLPPLDDSEVRRDKQTELQRPSRKRRRAGSLPETVVGRQLADHVHDIGGDVLSALREEIRAELRQEFQEKLDDVKLDFKRQLDKMRQENESYWAEAQATFWSADELPEAVADVIDTEIEQAKSGLRDHIDQELDEAEIRIEESVRNSLVDTLQEASLHLSLP